MAYMRTKTPRAGKAPPIHPGIADLFHKMADEAPGILSVRSVGKRGEVRMRHEIAGRRGRRPYLERQDFSVKAVSCYRLKEPTIVLFQISMRGSQDVLLTGVPSAVLAVVRR